MMFTLTPDAARQIRRAAADSDARGLVLRVAARRMRDGGIDYGMGFDETHDGDTRLDIEDVPVVIAPHHLELLQDTVLDFVELQPGQFHFIFIQRTQPPQGDATCGSGGCSHCGSGGCASH